MAELLYDLQDVTFKYQSIPALSGLDISIPEGQRVALLGSNGSGKSTLLRVLDGLYFPHSGTARFRGRLLSELNFEEERFAFEFRRQVGLVFQDADVQLFSSTVFDEVAFGPLQLRWPKEQIRDSVNAILESFQIADLRDRAPHRLSGGEKKRVALASVLVLDPGVLLLDEPTAGLDPRSGSQIIDRLVGWGGGQKSTITATHDLSSLEDIADWCYVLDHGKVCAQGTPADILADEPLLEHTNLVHAHRHRHPSGQLHFHPHRHSHEH